MPSAKWISRLVAFAAVVALGVAVQCKLDKQGDYTVTRAERTLTGNARDIQILETKVIARYPHARDAFTQGLIWRDGMLYESTGMRGESTLRLVELKSGQTSRQRDLAPSLFGEGIAIVENRIIQLTWTSGKAIVYRKSDFEPIGEFEYKGQGWGLCFDGERLIMSNGTADLVFRDPNTFATLGRVQVTMNGRLQSEINELECVDGAVYANVWGYDQIIRIDPKDGRVTAIIDAKELIPRDRRPEEQVLNGIAYMPETGRFLVTGKYWPSLFEVEFAPR